MIIDDFKIEQLKNNDYFVEGEYKKFDDSSIIFSSNSSRKEIIINRNYNINLSVDNDTLRCYGFSLLFDALNYRKGQCNIDNFKKVKMFYNNKIIYDEINFILPTKNIIYDNNKNILCIGENNNNGMLYEFASNSYVRVHNNHIIAFYIKINP